MLETIVYNLPLGITLVLEVSGNEKFKSRYLATAPERQNSPTEHLLDGQQRLTALWRSMFNNYERETYYIYIPEFDTSEDNIYSHAMMAYCQSRWNVRGKRYPLWADDPKICFSKGLIPTDLLRPQDIRKQIDQWVNQSLEHFMPKREDENFADLYEIYFKTKEGLDKKITWLRETITHYNIPYLSLPSTTPKEVALRVFINMNTNTKPLSLYDVIVAEVEDVKGVSIHDLQTELDEEFPKIKDYYDPEKLILTTSALLQNKLPSNTGMLEMDKSIMIDNWDTMKDGLNKMSIFLEKEGVYNRQLLPTNAVLAVIAALYSYIPETLDSRGKYEVLLQKYMWSSFFTDRYENSAATRAFRDFTMLSRILKGELNEQGQKYTEEDVPVLNRNQHPLATIEEFLQVGWPKRENIRARGLMCIASRLGAFDFSDGQKLNHNNIFKRDYHHIFPKDILDSNTVNPDLALNCAIITSATNRSIGSKDPLTVIKERHQIFDESTIRFRLNSHLIPTQPLKELSNSKSDDLLERTYLLFLKSRANLFSEAAQELCSGHQITIESTLQKSTGINPELRELDEEISKIELATRNIIEKKLADGFRGNPQEIVPEKIITSGKTKYQSWLRKNPGQEVEHSLTLRILLQNLTLSEYKDIILKKNNWPHIESVFNSHGNVMNRYTQLATMRNRIRHDNVLTLVEQKDGEAAIEWFNLALIDLIA